MSIEKGKKYELVVVSASAMGLLAISLCAFSKHIRRAIKKRDGYRSAESGVKGCLQCAHINHDKKSPDYNRLSNGRLLTVREHYLDHFNNHGTNGLNKEDNFATVKGLWFMLPKSKRKGLPRWDELE